MAFSLKSSYKIRKILITNCTKINKYLFASGFKDIIEMHNLLMAKYLLSVPYLMMMLIFKDDVAPFITCKIIGKC